MNIVLTALRYLLFPFSLLYATIISARNLMFNIGWLSSKEFNIPIISIGNISIGGTGKTPHTEYLIRLLSDHFRIATLSRGYKRKTKGFILADSFSNSYDIGDEPMQMKRKFSQINVAVDSDRVNGVNQLLALKPKSCPNCILLDDAYQHRYIKPGLSILLIDYNKPIYNDYVMPMGRLREWACGSKRADIIIISKCPNNINAVEIDKIRSEVKPLSHQNLYFTSLSYAPIKPVFYNDSDICISIENNKEKYSVLLVTGIANPKPLKLNLEKSYAEIKQLQFPDHYSFKQKDISTILDRFDSIESEFKIIITTEKDAIRFIDMDIKLTSIRKHMYYIPLEIEFAYDGGDNFNTEVLNFATAFNK